MGKTIKSKYDRYTLSFKLQAIKLADHPDITAIAVAESLGIHPVMLYRWRMEKKNGTLRDGYPMKKKDPLEPTLYPQTDHAPVAHTDLQDRFYTVWAVSRYSLKPPLSFGP